MSDEEMQKRDALLRVRTQNAEESRSAIETVLDEFCKKFRLGGVIKKSLRGSGLFTLPGLLKRKVVKKPATKARDGVNPFTGEKMTFKAKPASKKVRAVALKSLKGFVN